MSQKYTAFRPDGPTIRWRRRLPHWEQPGCTYFVTFRTADSLPATLVRQLEMQKSHWLREHPPPWDHELEKQFVTKFLMRVERLLDIGFGRCDLAIEEVSRIVESALRCFDGTRYHLDEFTVMPTHVHSLLLPLGGFSLAEILASWKSYTGRAINGILGRQGRFWMEESFDRIVRDLEELVRYRRYIRMNPVQAGLLGTSRYRLGCGLGVKH